jgi:hypothetical protein
MSPSLPLYDIDPYVDFIVEAASRCPSGHTETPTNVRTLLGRMLFGGDCRRTMRGRNCRRSRRAMRPKAEPLAQPAANAAVPRAPNVAAAPPNLAPMKVLPPTASRKPAKRFPPSVKKGRQFDVPDGIIAHLTRECGGNVHDRHVVDVTCGSFEQETVGANPHSWHTIAIPLLLQRMQPI